MTRPERPRYLHRPAPVCAQQPGLVAESKVYAFGFDADTDAIDACADRYLNAARADGLVYRAVAPVSIVTFLDAARLTSTSDPYGYLPDKEAAFWTLMAACTPHGDGFKMQRLCWWNPWIWVDTAAAMATGREVWGWPKTMGSFDIPQAPGDDARFVGHTRVFPKLGPDCAGTIQPLVTVARTDGGRLGPLPSVWGGAIEVAESVAHFVVDALEGRDLPSWALLVDIFELVRNVEVPMVNLLQLRDPADGTRAAYQSIVESTCHPTKFAGGGLLDGTWELTLLDVESAPIAADLGLGGNTARARWAAWVGMDFVVNEGREVWRAGGGRL